MHLIRVCAIRRADAVRAFSRKRAGAVRAFARRIADAVGAPVRPMRHHERWRPRVQKAPFEVPVEVAPSKGVAGLSRSRNRARATTARRPERPSSNGTRPCPRSLPARQLGTARSFWPGQLRAGTRAPTRTGSPPAPARRGHRRVRARRKTPKAATQSGQVRGAPLPPPQMRDECG